MKKCGCPYCNKGEALDKFGVLAFETETSEIIVFNDQHHKGRAIVAYKADHIAEIQDLSDEERNKFMADVADTAKSIQKAYHPDRINYGAYGDTLGHLHIHLVPKYKDGFEWGGTFVMNTNEYATEEELNMVVENIKNNFRK